MSTQLVDVKSFNLAKCFELKGSFPGQWYKINTKNCVFYTASLKMAL